MLGISIWLIPLIVMGVLLVLMLLLVFLGRIRGGRYLRPVMQVLMKVPLLNRGLKKMSRAALERQNPELASAVRKLERANADKDPIRAQKVLQQLTADERRAYMAAVEEQEAIPAAVNRQQRRQLQKARKRR